MMHLQTYKTCIITNQFQRAVFPVKIRDELRQTRPDHQNVLGVGHGRLEQVDHEAVNPMLAPEIGRILDHNRSANVRFFPDRVAKITLQKIPEAEIQLQAPLDFAWVCVCVF